MQAEESKQELQHLFRSSLLTVQLFIPDNAVEERHVLRIEIADEHQRAIVDDERMRPWMGDELSEARAIVLRRLEEDAVLRLDLLPQPRNIRDRRKTDALRHPRWNFDRVVVDHFTLPRI